ncbi:DoxX family protein [Actinacidiphila sp. ITFR-21]|uniref:DoxX family protein n=1 Tax=Actinacidiphila sp. ITFR-21 TaxID=3075199 RepID=UPI00288A36C8|nr:DoxX family protein [Streptomyces sp. ITFR-21]WNI14373.1 DoxX family protein [Streptomyces sp. ITFR-21]
MAVLRRLARPLLASVFISGGYTTLRHPDAVAPAAEPVALPLAERIKALPRDPRQLVRINSAVQLGAGTLLALGRFPRAASLTLAATLVPTTLAGHPYWTIEDPGERARQRVHFLRNLSVLGGLLLAAADTHGKPSLVYRARRGTRHATDTTAEHVHAAVDGLHATAAGVTGGLHSAAADVSDGLHTAAATVRDRLPLG